MRIGKTIKIIERPDAIPIELPKQPKRKRDKPEPIGIPVDWPVRKHEPARKSSG